MSIRSCAPQLRGGVEGGDGPGGPNPCPFSQRGESALFLGHFLSLDLGMAMRLFIVFLFGSLQVIIIIKILVTFLPFLNLKNIIPAMSAINKIHIMPFFVAWTLSL